MSISRVFTFAMQSWTSARKGLLPTIASEFIVTLSTEAYANRTARGACERVMTPRWGLLLEGYAQIWMVRQVWCRSAERLRSGVPLFSWKRIKQERRKYSAFDVGVWSSPTFRFSSKLRCWPLCRVHSYRFGEHTCPQTGLQLRSVWGEVRTYSAVDRRTMYEKEVSAVKVICCFWMAWRSTDAISQCLARATRRFRLSICYKWCCCVTAKRNPIRRRSIFETKLLSIANTKREYARGVEANIKSHCNVSSLRWRTLGGARNRYIEWDGDPPILLIRRSLGGTKWPHRSKYILRFYGVLVRQ